MTFRRAFLIAWIFLAGYSFAIVATIIGAMFDWRDDHDNRLYPLRPCLLSDILQFVREYEKLLDLEDAYENSRG